MKWAGDANALIVATGYLSLAPEAQIAINCLSFANRVTKRERLMMILHKARSQVELEMRQVGAQSADASGDVKSINDLISLYYMEDPRRSYVDRRTSSLGFRPSPVDENVRPPITEARGTEDAGQELVRETKLEELAVKVALLEAAISAPKPPGMMGHNRGPNLETEQDDEEEIRRLISLLKGERERILISAVLKDLAQQEIQRAEQGIKLHSEFAKGLAKGAGYVAGKDIVERLAGSAWWLSVYERLRDVAHVLRDLIF
ncbi:hypothetical protein AS156_36015 [Bradyrhizobium macuxiense]|uniref:Uncharacterized protein n=2 Tax=Bradyrhizobium macuxiense TaxID=1755647 RepID=A0A109JZW1_9BRAD|nr:hypothetical protein AS156_36015 [Bradyrhizobium macuxiense]